MPEEGREVHRNEQEKAMTGFEMTITFATEEEVPAGSYQALAMAVGKILYVNDERWAAGFHAFWATLNTWSTGNPYTRLEQAVKANINTSLYEFPGNDSDRKALVDAALETLASFVDSIRPVRKTPTQQQMSQQETATTKQQPRRAAVRPAGPPESPSASTAQPQTSSDAPQGQPGLWNRTKAALTRKQS
jgi:hypothetical protein